jgi:hypothetical protein
VAGLRHCRARASPEAVFGSRAPRIEVNEAGKEPRSGYYRTECVGTRWHALHPILSGVRNKIVGDSGVAPVLPRAGGLAAAIGPSCLSPPVHQERHRGGSPAAQTSEWVMRNSGPGCELIHLQRWSKTAGRVAQNSGGSAVTHIRTRGRPFGKGQSGNPGGRPRVEGEIRELARQHTGTALRTLIEIAEHGENENDWRMLIQGARCSTEPSECRGTSNGCSESPRVRRACTPSASQHAASRTSE